MDERERELIRACTDRLTALLAEGQAEGLAPADGVPADLHPLVEAVNQLVAAFAASQEFILALADGNLDVAPPPRNQLVAPYKQLHANLRHLTWQAKQIAAGDLNQRVDYLGEFSIAFNEMINALREKRRTEEQLRHLSIHDPLTGVYNRMYFTEEMERLERGRHYPVSIIVADLDGLKQVNDTQGHAAGDRLIQAAAQVLKDGVRADDVVARIGGDEFAVILSDTTAASAATVLERIRECEGEVNCHATDFVVSLSLGTATAELKGSVEEALRVADLRMYEDKFARKQGRTPPTPFRLSE
ncbi:GGDEF domain-containing protein [Geobacter sp.]|uniref:GGDEF domain-containing protein n=1 Tax=Geobacter sp. TaxID=46610 RepID=UPI001AC55AD1|nr:GGDEF domain-containing protein [Geobacter sp.]CAG0933915.1 putative diguanylate cyclase DgcT [Rhodocyclaceae bacterium]